MATIFEDQSIVLILPLFLLSNTLNKFPVMASESKKSPALVPAAKMLLFLSLNLIEETISLICIVFLMSYLLVCDLSKNNSFSIVKASKF